MTLKTIEYKKVFDFPDRQLEVEIGVFYGKFLTARSNLYPSTNFIGIEIHPQKANQFILNNKDANNIKVLLTDARCIIQDQMPDNYVKNYWMFNPEPFPDQPELNLLDKDFANGMIRSLCIGGEINIVTTEMWFSQETKEFFSSLKEVDPFIPDEKHKTVMELCYSPNILNRMAFRKEG